MFCAAYGRLLDAERMPSSTVEEVRAALAATRAALADEVDTAPAALANDVAQSRVDVERGLAVIDRYGDDVDAALSSATGDDARVLNSLGGPVDPASADGHIQAFARSACPELAVPTAEKFSTVASTLGP